MKQFGLKQVNNVAFLRGDAETVKSLIQVQNYVAFGYPTKSLVNELVRKRGHIKKDGKRMPITDNTLIEELLGSHGVICLEDIIDTLVNCHKEGMPFKEVLESIWPIQLHPLKEESSKANVKHDATGEDIKKKNTRVNKGGYLGLMGDKINDFVKPLI